MGNLNEDLIDKSKENIFESPKTSSWTSLKRTSWTIFKSSTQNSQIRTVLRLLKRSLLTTQRMKASWTMLKRRVKKKSDINYEARQTLTIHRKGYLKKTTLT